MVTREEILQLLPRYNDSWILVKEKQHVKDIIKLICKRHIDFANDYDKIGSLFIGESLEATCNNLNSFCRRYLHYYEESEHEQTVGSPAAIVTRGKNPGVDCKSYALFNAGCLDAIQRLTGDVINWHYCFASYDIGQKTPYHVFVVVDTDEKQMYLDPTPGAENKQPVWIVNKKVETTGSKRVGFVLPGLDNLVQQTDTSTAGSWGTLMPPPSWYPSHLPKFYNNGDGFRLRPLNAVPKYTANDVLDTCLYLQTLIGYNRVDWQNARSAAWRYADGSGSAKMWVQSAFMKDSNGDGSGNFADISSNGQSIDGVFYSELQARYISNESKARPWLSSMQAKGGGIDLLTIPMGNDAEIPRPSWYASYLPSLFVAPGNMGQYPAGFMTTKPMIRNGRSSGWTSYEITPADVASLMLYAQPVIAIGPTPYPLNWYLNDTVNGATATRFKISLAFENGFSDTQLQTYGISGDMMKLPQLDADPYASGFTHALQSVVSFAVNFFAGKIPGGTSLTKAANTLAAAGGSAINGGEVSPAGTFSAAVFQAADLIAAGLQQDLADKEQQKKYLLAFLAAAAALGWYYRKDLKKAFA